MKVSDLEAFIVVNEKVKKEKTGSTKKFQNTLNNILEEMKTKSNHKDDIHLKEKRKKQDAIKIIDENFIQLPEELACLLKVNRIEISNLKEWIEGLGGALHTLKEKLNQGKISLEKSLSKLNIKETLQIDSLIEKLIQSSAEIKKLMEQELLNPQQVNGWIQKLSVNVKELKRLVGEENNKAENTVLIQSTLMKEEMQSLNKWKNIGRDEGVPLLKEKNQLYSLMNIKKINAKLASSDKITSTFHSQTNSGGKEKINKKKGTVNFQQGYMQPSQQLHLFSQLNAVHKNSEFNQTVATPFAQIIEKGLFQTLPNGAKQFSIQLYPEHLGKMEVELVMKNQEMIARLIVSSQQAKDLIESQLHQLRQVIVQQNLEVDKWEVIIDEQKQMMQQGEGEKERNASSQNHQQQEKQEEEQNFFESFLDFLLDSKEEGEEYVRS